LVLHTRPCTWLSATHIWMSIACAVLLVNVLSTLGQYTVASRPSG
jgi:hypothetical protein